MKDTGVGIAPESIGKVFEPFFTTKEAVAGTGLGLATSAFLVEQANGVIRVRSELGHGAEFSVYLPATKARPVAHPDAGAAPPTEGEGTVLVVEDEAALRRLIAQAVE